ncbi:MAG: hypothetical protein ACOYYS_01400 [Chloroflexota bacterium]
MVSFLAHQPADIQKGDLVTVQQIVDAFAKEKQAGLIEIAWASGQQAVILLADGQVMGVNMLETTFCKKISFEELPTHWLKSHATLRSIRARHEMVGAAMAVLAWHPPNQTFSLQAGEFPAYLEISQKHQHNGLFRILCDGLEGYVFLLAGQPLHHECVLDAPHEMLVGAQAYERLLACSQPSSLEFYEAGPASPVYQQICFRFTFAQLIQGMSNRYARLVGADMVESMVVTLNQQLAERQYHMEIRENQLYDTHVFPSYGVAMQAYRFLFKSVMQQMSEMIGNGLAHSIAFEVFRSLPPEKQQFLRESPLMILIISSS